MDSAADFRAAILAALGHAPERIEPGRLHRFATSDRRGDLAGWCRLFPDGRAGVYGCHRSGISAVWAAASRKALTPAQRREVARQVQAAAIERQTRQAHEWQQAAGRIGRIWSQCRSIEPGDPVAQYLRRRGLAGPWPACIRLHPALPYWQEGQRLGDWPAMVAPLVAPEGRMVALHRTWLTDGGHKAPVPTPKKLTGAAGPLDGACIPLARPTARGVIGIAEGIETALSVTAASGLPCVAAYCAGSLAAWRWPDSARCIVIAADNDRAGREAADTLRARALAAWLAVRIVAPSEPGADWNDALLRAGGEVSA